jgi:hypothetical protein
MAYNVIDMAGNNWFLTTIALSFVPDVDAVTAGSTRIPVRSAPLY